MEEKNRRTAEEPLSQQLRKSKGGRLGGMLLSLSGGVIAAAGIIQGGSIALIVLGAVLLALGQAVQGRSKAQAGQQAFDAIAPEIVGAVFENIQTNPIAPILDTKDTNIPLPGHTHCSGSGYIRGTYRGLTTELCTIRLTEVNEFPREETGLWEKSECEVYVGQWLLCKLGRDVSTWLTIWPQEKLLRSKTIQAGNAAFDRRFHLSSDDESSALRILTPGRMERILALADSCAGKFSVNLNRDGRLYLAVHSGCGFFDIGKGHETPAQLRRRFAQELKWFTDMIDVFDGV